MTTDNFFTPVEETVLCNAFMWMTTGLQYVSVSKNGHYGLTEYVNIMFVKCCIAFFSMNVAPYFSPKELQ